MPGDRRPHEPPAPRELADRPRARRRAASPPGRSCGGTGRAWRARGASADRARRRASSPPSSAGSSGRAARCATTSRRGTPTTTTTTTVERNDRGTARRTTATPTTGYDATTAARRDAAPTTTHGRRRPRRHRPRASDRHRRLRGRFAAEHPFPLDDFQRRALDALDAGRSVLVAAPTGSGKTLVAEYAIAAALEPGGEGLLHDAAEGAVEPEVRRLRARATAPSNVGLLTGDNVDQRRGAGRRDDHRGAAQHDLRRLADARTACATSCSTRSTTSRTAPRARCGRR